MTENYNMFFYANVCHVCKRFGKEVVLKRCGNCGMISYCGKEHQKYHWPRHKDLCKAICNVFRDNRMLNFFKKTQDISIETWTRMKMNIMLLSTIKVGRRLEQYEEQMFKFPRACVTCHEQNAQLLRDCQNCMCVSFCPEHVETSMHKSYCHLFKLSLSLDIALMKLKSRIPKPAISYLISETQLPNNMSAFINRYTNLNKPTDFTFEEQRAFYAEYLTRPLTLLYAMQELSYHVKHNDIIIHIIGANVIDLYGIELWEILLHWLTPVLSINIILIGPELNQDTISIELCEDCSCKRKCLKISTYGMLYHEYINTAAFQKSDFTIGYNAGIHECKNPASDTWIPSIKVLAKQTCPLILTSYTSQEAEEEHERLKQIIGQNLKYKIIKQNPYSSMRPYRDYETETIYYQNYYIIIYTQLKSNIHTSTM